eukprot:CAMPEP_0197038780 /NCGR_PEP_ID=MMETSP1384-20130603/15667_1 /TAXON_ID=29189 /ORGANISM="Ammonia sp." /LENGTH=557 /DNA_ID=CAMNT_0042469267 /DNA_START=59 /DNA_END=1732 /DNA_ORIENTATION=-
MSDSAPYGITQSSLRDEVHHIVYQSDLRKITQRSVFQRLEDKYGIDLVEYKAFIYERAVEEARVRIQSSPELQKQQQMSNSKYYYHGDVNTQQQRKFYNTIYNTPNSYYLSTAGFNGNEDGEPEHSDDDENDDDNHNHKKHDNDSLPPVVNYQDVKKHYIGLSNKSHRNRIKSVSGCDEYSNHDEGPPLKKRKYDLHCRRQSVVSSPKRHAQSTREADKDTEYEFSEEFKEMMGRQRGTWRQCWDWITNYATRHHLRAGNRKIHCDAVLKKAFNRDESSVSGVSRLIWKHLIGAVEVDEHGNFKKLVYKKRKVKRSRDGQAGSDDDDEEDSDSDNDEEEEDEDEEEGDDDDDEEDEDEDEENAQQRQQQQHTTPRVHTQYHPMPQSQTQRQIQETHRAETKAEAPKKQEPPRKKRRYRKRERDENGQIIKKRKRSGLTRLCFMSDELRAVVGKDGPMPRNKITKGFWDYTEAHGLKRKGRIILCDVALKKIWGEHVEQIHMYSVQKGLKEHITTMNKEEEKRYKLANPHLFDEEELEHVKKGMAKASNGKNRNVSVN